MSNFFTFLPPTEPPLLGPGAGFPASFGPPDFHPAAAAETWKAGAIHPTGLIKEPVIAATRNGAVNFATSTTPQVAQYVKLIEFSNILLHF